MADVFERNGAQPAHQPGRKIGQDHAAHMAQLGLQELRNTAGPGPQHVPSPQPQPDRGRPRGG